MIENELIDLFKQRETMRATAPPYYSSNIILSKEEKDRREVQHYKFKKLLIEKAEYFRDKEIAMSGTIEEISTNRIVVLSDPVISSTDSNGKIFKKSYQISVHFEPYSGTSSFACKDKVFLTARIIQVNIIATKLFHSITLPIPDVFAKNIIFEKKISDKGNCFIATVVFGGYDAPEVLILREFRDKKMLPSSLGRFIVKIYFAISPYFANIIGNSKALKSIFKSLLSLLIKKLQSKN